MTIIDNFNEVPTSPKKITPNMTVYLANEDDTKWIEINGAHIRDEPNEDYIDNDLKEFYELREDIDENLYSFVENVCREYGFTYEKIKDNTGDEPSYYYHIHNKEALIEAARKYVAENA